MKRYLTLLLIFFSMALFSCMKPRHHHETKYITLTPTLKSGATYTLDISQYGDEDDKAVISKQAQNYSTSAISVTGSHRFIYSFSDFTKSTGSETVQIKLTEQCRDEEEAVIDINFTLTL